MGRVNYSVYKNAKETRQHALIMPTGVARHPRAARSGIVCCCVRSSYVAGLTVHSQWGSAIFRFF